MTISLKHAFTSAIPDGGDATVVQPSNWNAEHTLQLATARLVGRTTGGTGTAEEIAVSNNLSLSGGVLDLASPLGTPLPVASGGTGANTPNYALTSLTTLASTATAAGTTVLTNTSAYFQYFTGATTQTVTLPVTSVLATGWSFHIVNNATGNVTVNSSGGNLVIVVLPGTTVMVTCIGTTLTTAADWEAGYTDFSTATGTGSVVLAASPTLTGTTTLATAAATLVTATSIVATAGAGYQNIDVLTSGSSATYNLPASVQVVGLKFKVTVIGGGAGGGGTNVTAGQAGGGGGSGAYGEIYLTYVSGQNTITYTVGAAVAAAAANTAGTAGNASSITYNALTYTAGGGAGGAANGLGGAGGTVSGTSFTLSQAGQAGSSGGVMAATSNYIPHGGDTPRGFGFGGRMSGTAAGGAGSLGTGNGSGGSGARNGTGVVSLAGGGGTAGLILVEY